MSTAKLLIETARELFSANGFEATSVRDICEQAGASPSAISYHFNNKQGLYDAVLTQFNADSTELVGSLLDAPQSAEDFKIRLRLFSETLVLSLLEDVSLYKHIMFQLEKEPCPLPQAFQTQLIELYGIITRFFEAAIERGILKPNLKADIVAAMLINQISNSIKGDDLKRRFFDKSLRDEAYRKYWLEHFLNTLFDGTLNA